MRVWCQWGVVAVVGMLLSGYLGCDAGTIFRDETVSLTPQSDMGVRPVALGAKVAVSGWIYSEGLEVPMFISAVEPLTPGIVSVGDIEENRFELLAEGEGQTRIRVKGHDSSHGFSIDVVPAASLRVADFDTGLRAIENGEVTPVALRGATIRLQAEHLDAEGEPLTGYGLVEWEIVSGEGARLEPIEDVPGELIDVVLGAGDVEVVADGESVKVAAVGVEDIDRLDVIGETAEQGTVTLQVKRYERRHVSIAARVGSDGVLIGTSESRPTLEVLEGEGHLDLGLGLAFRSDMGSGPVLNRQVNFSVYPTERAPGEVEIQWHGKTLKVRIEVVP